MLIMFLELFFCCGFCAWGFVLFSSYGNLMMEEANIFLKAYLVIDLPITKGIG
jgi:hypothetical protein